MPHMFTNRPRLHNLTKGRSDIRAQFRWETINAVFYKVGGLLFIIGSICFFPRFGAYSDLGAWIFFVGSLIYLVVTVHDLLEVAVIGGRLAITVEMISLSIRRPQAMCGARSCLPWAAFSFFPPWAGFTPALGHLCPAACCLLSAQALTFSKSCSLVRSLPFSS